MTRDQTPEQVPDWLLGGHVRRRVLENLLNKQGWTAIDLAEHIDAGQASVFEVFRAMKPLGALERAGPRGTYRLSHHGVGAAIRCLIAASAQFNDDPVSRPPGRVKSHPRRTRLGK